MGQNWAIVNVDAREEYGVSGQLGKSFWDPGIPTALFKLPQWPAENFWKLSVKSLELRCRGTSPQILRLPMELLNLIFSALDNLMDIICLCITHGILGVAGEARLRQVHEQKTAAWAGERILSIGDYSNNYDFPAHIRDIIQEQIPVDLTPTEGHGWSDRFYHFVFEHYRRPNISRLSYHSLEGFEDRHLIWAFRGVDVTRWHTVDRMLQDAYTYKDVVLCNLSKAEYVRGDGIDKFSSFASQKQPGVSVNLGHVVLANICWSSDPSCAMTDEISAKLTRGQWAGDRFEVTSFSSLREGIEWKDVTKREVKWLADIFAANFGEEEYDPDE